MSSGFYERLSAISSDPSSPDGMTELVVAALGSFGRYYICWKTRSGEYRQESSGLPTPLQQWLFPNEPNANGQHTRDFATLQVVLGHGDDFFAADRDGKVERKATSSSSSSTPDRTASPQPNNNDHRSSAPVAGTRPLERSSSTRRRSRTMSMAGPPIPTFRLSQAAAAVSPISELPGDRRGDGGSAVAVGQRLSGGGGVKTMATPTTMMKPLVAGTRRNVDWGTTRPRSIAFGEGELLRVPEGGLRAPREQQLAPRSRVRGTSSPSPPPPAAAVGRGEGGGEDQGACCKCGCHAAAAAQPPPALPRPTYTTTGTQAKMVPAEPPRPAYVDAGIQTDPPPRVRRSTSSSSSSSRRKRRSVAYSSSSSISYSSSGASSSYDSESESGSSRRSSAELTDITTPSTYEGGVPSGNPVRMGKMQDYFRSSGYQLGDSLRPAQYQGGFGGFDTGWARGWGGFSTA